MNLLTARGLRQRYPGAAEEALRGVDLDLESGSVTGLVGDNGAGKSTLIRALASSTNRTAGEVGVRGNPDPLSAGLMRHVPQYQPRLAGLTCAEAWTVLGGPAEHAPFPKHAGLVGLSGIKPNTQHSRLGDPEAAMLALQAALDSNAPVLLLDEPDALLDQAAADVLARALSRARAAGRAVLVASHRLQRVLEWSDRILLMRHGRLEASYARRELDRTMLAELLGGAALEPERPPRGEGPPVLVVEAAVLGERARKPVSFRVPRGCILGLHAGPGISVDRAAAALAGAYPMAGSRTMDPALSLSWLPSRRLTEAADPSLAMWENLAIHDRKLLFPGGMADRAYIEKRVEEVAELAGLALAPRMPMHALSGGMMQRTVLARELHRSPDLLILAEPFAGLDATAQSHLCYHLDCHARAGGASILISTDRDGLEHISDTVLELA